MPFTNNNGDAPRAVTFSFYFISTLRNSSLVFNSPSRIEVFMVSIERKHSHDTNEALQLIYKLVNAAEKEVLVIFSSSKAFIRKVNVGGGQRVIKVANSRNVNVVMLIPMNEVAKIMAKDLESQSTNIQIRAIALNRKMCNK